MLMDRQGTIARFALNKKQIKQIEVFLEQLKLKNELINLVGKSTILSFWDRHVCDSLQIIQHIKDKKDKIIDMGSGAGVPGIFLSIAGCSDVLMVDSIKKKAEFIKTLVTKLEVSAEVSNNRLEDLNTKPPKYIVARALAPLNKLISYSLLLSKKDTSLLFLKGRSVNKEVEEAKKNYNFKLKIFKSISAGGGFVLKITDFKKK